MSRHVRAVEGSKHAERAEGLSAFRTAILAALPELAELLSKRANGSELVDVLEAVPGPRRSIMKAARSGKIRGAVCVGRRWLAPREALTEWLRTVGPRALPAAKSEEDGDELEPLRRRLLAGARR